MTFLPNNYSLPKSDSKYMKLEKGQNKFRVLDAAVVGHIYWSTENKPVRSKDPFEFMPADIRIQDGKPDRIKHFWAFPVWDYSDNQVKILEITQASIQSALKTKVENRNGVATQNDIIITKSGDGLGTEYEVDMLDATPTKPEILEAYKATTINLDALFRSEDPFAATASQPTVKDTVVGDVDVSDIPF